MYYSIVIPCYNAEQHLMETLNVISDFFKHSNKSAEYLLVDDGSRDNTWLVIKEIVTLYPDTIGIKLKKNHGQTVATNVGIYYSAGERIITMDDDLKYNLDVIVEMERAAEHENLIYAFIPQKNIMHLMRIFFDFLGGKKLATSFRYMKRELIPKEYLIREQLEIYFQKIEYIKINTTIIPTKQYKDIPSRTNIFSRLKFILFLMPNFPNNKLIYVCILFLTISIISFCLNLRIWNLVSFTLFILGVLWLMFKYRFNYFYNIDNPSDIIEDLLKR